MEKKYKCEMCGSESSDTPGTCCGKERNPSESNSCTVEDSNETKTEHTHKEGETCEVCSVENK